MTFLRICNWDKYQGEIKRRSGSQDWRAPWMKLYHQILDDFDFSNLSEADRFQVVGLMLLACRRGNKVRADQSYLKHQLRINRNVNLESFREVGFIETFTENDSGTIQETFANDSPPEERRGEERREEENTPSSPTDVGALFDSFWKAYPRKVGKQAALKAFKKIKGPVTTLPAILDAIRVQKTSDQWRKDNGQFIPNPATWLNQGRWEDEIDTGNNGTGPPPMTPDQRANLQAVIDMRKREGLDTADLERRINA